MTRESENKIIHRKEKTLSEWISDFVNEKEMKKNNIEMRRRLRQNKKLNPFRCT